MLREINGTSVMVWLSLLGRPNYLIYSLLLKEFGSAEGIYNAFLAGRKPESLRAYENVLTAFADQGLAAQAAEICNKAEECGMKIVTLNDVNYPYKLRNLPSACPLVLYYYGEINEEDFSEDGVSVAVVGSRHCSVSGEANAESFSYELSKRGVNIVSGLARGCDGAAHTGALKAGGRTTAVLASGADVIYPPEHRNMYNRIIRSGGCVMSESPPGTIPCKQLFPARNRIIAGLSDAVIVVEAAKKSGALITADRALEADRLVFALPGDVRNPMAYGANELIRQGAVCALDVGIVLEELGIADEKAVKRKPGNGSAAGLPYPQNAVYNAIIHGAVNADEIAAVTQLEINDIGSALTLLEVRGLIKSTGTGMVRESLGNR